MTSSARDIYTDIIAHFDDGAAREEMRRGVDELAEDVAEYAKSISPPHVDSGEYRDSIHTSPLDDVKGMPARRVIASDYKAHWIEYGTGAPAPTPEFAVFAKAADKFNGDQSGDFLD